MSDTNIAEAENQPSTQPEAPLDTAQTLYLMQSAPYSALPSTRPKSEAGEIWKATIWAADTKDAPAHPEDSEGEDEKTHDADGELLPNYLSIRSGLLLNRRPLTEAARQHVIANATKIEDLYNWDFIDKVAGRLTTQANGLSTGEKILYNHAPVCLCTASIVSGEDCRQYLVQDDNGFLKNEAVDHIAVLIFPYSNFYEGNEPKEIRICPYAKLASFDRPGGAILSCPARAPHDSTSSNGFFLSQPNSRWIFQGATSTKVPSTIDRLYGTLQADKSRQCFKCQGKPVEDMTASGALRPAQEFLKGLMITELKYSADKELWFHKDDFAVQSGMVPWASCVDEP